MPEEDEAYAIIAAKSLKSSAWTEDHVTPMTPLPLYSVNGDNYQIGLAIGKRFRPRIVDFLTRSKELRRLQQAEKRNPRLQKIVEYGKKYFPQYMREIRGIADGSASSSTDILLINCKYDFPRRGCTTVILKESDRIILAHNEDNTRSNLGNCYLLKVYPDDGMPFASFCYPGMIPGNSFGFNACGMVITNNAMPTPDTKLGCPRHLIDRSQLESKNMDETIERTLFEDRASGGSFNIISQKEKRAVNIETTSERHCITEVGNEYLHANHYVSRKLSNPSIDESFLKSTLSRYKVGSKSLSEVKERTPQTALDIMGSLEAKPYSIMRIDKRMRVRTLFTALFEVSRDEITLRVYEPNPRMREGDILSELALGDIT